MNTSVETERIAVHIIEVEPVPEEIRAPILWGLEEEGIPSAIRSESEGDARQLAKKAAVQSPLNVGIGIDGAAGAVALHHRDLPNEKPLFLVGPKEMKPEVLRRLGANAARLAKGEPLILGDEGSSTETSQRDSRLPQEPLEQIVAQVLKEIVNIKKGQ